jgi:hypothetical protein
MSKIMNGRDFDVSQWTLQKGWQEYQQTDGLLFEFCETGPVRQLSKFVGGEHWNVIVTATRGRGDVGKVFLVPVSSEARRLVRGHTLFKWTIDFRLTTQQATRLYSSRAKYKREFMEKIVSAIQDSHCHLAVKSFPGLSSGRAHLRWQTRWSENGCHVADMLWAGSWPRTEQVIQAIRDVIG